VLCANFLNASKRFAAGSDGMVQPANALRAATTHARAHTHTHMQPGGLEQEMNVSCKSCSAL
jgi:hypothetical protein